MFCNAAAVRESFEVTTDNSKETAHSQSEFYTRSIWIHFPTLVREEDVLPGNTE